MIELTASSLLDGNLRSLLVKAHVEQSIEIGRHIGGVVRLYGCQWWGLNEGQRSELDGWTGRRKERRFG